MDDPAASQNADVTGDRLVREIERLGELADGRLATSEPSNDRPAGPVTERGKGCIQFDAGGWHG
jgi:hypothetical protein